MNTKKASLYDKEKLTSGYDFDPFFTFRCVFCLVCVAQTPRVAGISEYIKKAKIKDAINSTNTSHTTTNHLINDTWEYSSSSALGDLWLAVLFFFYSSFWPIQCRFHLSTVFTSFELFAHIDPSSTFRSFYFIYFCSKRNHLILRKCYRSKLNMVYLTLNTFFRCEAWNLAVFLYII